MKYIPHLITATTLSLLGGVLVAHAYVPLVSLPGVTDVGSTFVPGTNVDVSMTTYLAGMLKLLIAVGGVIAIVVAIVGGTQFVAAGANPAAKSGAKERIMNAFIGLALILASWLILNSINPDLLKGGFTLPQADVPTSPLPAIITTRVDTGPTAQTCPTPNDTSQICCPKGIPCQACNGTGNGCSVVDVPNKGCGIMNQNCFLETGLLGRIKNITTIGYWRVTESWPPTVYHQSVCHQMGTCADLNPTTGRTDPTTIGNYYNAFKAAGLNVLYESKNCAPYRAAIPGINCGTYPTMTSNSSFHVW